MQIILCSFYTATILEWKKLLKPDKYKQILIKSLEFLVSEKRVKIYGFVIMENHIHLLWQGTQLYSLKYTQLSFMKYTAQQIKFDLEKYHPEVLTYFTVEAKDRKHQFWERNALSVDIMSETVFRPCWCYHQQVQLQNMLFVKTPTAA